MTVLGEGEHTSLPERYSAVLWTAFSSLSPFQPSRLPRDSTVPVPWEEECGITPRGVGWALVRGAGAAPLLGSPDVPGRAGYLLPFPAERSCIPSDEQRGTGNRAAAWKQIPALTFKCFKVLDFLPPIWWHFDLFIHWSVSWSNCSGSSDGWVFVCFIRGISVSVLGGYQSLSEFCGCHTKPPWTKAGLVGLSFKYYSDIKMARELLMLYTAFIVCKWYRSCL